MTLKQLAEDLRKVAYDLDESHRLWDANEKLYRELQATASGLTYQLAERKAEVARLTRQIVLLKRRIPRPTKKKARR